MKPYTLLFILPGMLALSFCKEPMKKEKSERKNAPAITGIGGIFFKCKDPEKMREWYAGNFGIATNEYGAVFEFRKSENPEEKGYLQWSPFSEKTKYFEPSQKEFMINYRVRNIEQLVETLRKNGVTIVDTIETVEYGKFVHILDPEGGKIELWEPVDSVFGSYDGTTNY